MPLVALTRSVDTRLNSLNCDRCMHHNGDDAGAPDRALREFERRPKIAASNAWVVSGVSSRATTTVSAVLRAGTACGPRSSFATLFSDVRTRLASICRNEVIRSQLGRRLWKWRSPRGYRCEYQFDLELTCPASAQLATACRLRLRRIHRH